MQNPPQAQPTRDYYSKANFWDERYQAGGYFDWYAEFPQLQYAFENQYGMTKQDWILMVGCGNSKLSQQMYEAGYKNIVNIDISPTVIEQMKQLSPGMEWLVMDATEMTFQDSKFDFVIDKGTMDALIAGRDLSPAVKLLKECMRVTKEEGQLIQITYGSPEGRKKVFQLALPFNTFDYYFAYVNLNDMSTMINLMRNNLIGPDGQKIEKDIALQKSMKDFMMIKLLRAKRSKDKQFVVWQNFAKTTPLEVPQKSSTQQTLKQNSASKVQQKATDKPKEVQSKTQQLQAQANLNDNIKYQSKSQKQSYVYAYSIKRKFGYDFDPAELKQSQIQKSQQGNSVQHPHFEIKGSQIVNQSIGFSKAYCFKKQISHASVDFLGLNNQFLNKNESIKLKIEESNSARINVMSKSNIELQVEFTDLSVVSEQMKKLCHYLTQKMGLNFHPCPKTYSLFVVMRGRMKAKTVNQLLAKYWYPTFEFSDINLSEGKAMVVLAIPPVLSQHLDTVENLINGYFSKCKPLKVSIVSTRNGFISFPELKLLSTMNILSLSHNLSKSLEVSMQDFWSGEKSHEPQEQSKHFIVENSRLEVPTKIVPLAILHLMALY